MKTNHQALGLHEDNLKILGHQLKQVRLKRDYSLRGMARAMHLSPSVIADIEEGRRITTCDVLAQMFGHLNMVFLHDPILIKAAIADCKLYHEALYHRNHDFATEIYARLEAVTPSLEHSPLLVEMQWVRVAHKFFVKADYDLTQLEAYTSYIQYFSEEQTQRYYFLLGYAYLYQDAPETGFAYLMKARQFTANNRLYGMTLTRLAELHQYRHELYQAIETSRLASKIHAENANVYEKFESDWRLARNLIEVGSNDEARILITHMEASLLVNSEENGWVLSHVRFLRALAEYMIGHAEGALRVMAQHDDMLNLEYGRFFHALVLDTLGRTTEALATLKQQLADHPDSTSVFKDLAVYFMHYLDKETQVSEFEAHLEPFLNKPNKIPSPFIYHWVLDCAVRFLEGRGEIAKAFEIAKHALANRTFY
ncbi:MAG: XRE family transcriptional regulator [Acholeplasmatales bacterium]|nr:MAG: XRE family transcriptional regulator [Acholeplasmatales bacterium]